MTDEHGPEREERLIAEMLRERGAIDPGRLGPVIDLAALGLVSSAWRNTCVEGWHAEGRLHDGDMMRVSSHMTWRARQILHRWMTETGLGPHPNKAHAAWGRRAHRLEPDPATAPVVRWMFAQRLAGRSVARITRALNDAGVPRPSAADPGRNPHRTGAGWTLRTVAAILANPRYTGRQVWNRQRTDFDLADPPTLAWGISRSSGGTCPRLRLPQAGTADDARRQFSKGGREQLI